ncbi:MAG: hypothetical protein IJC31_09800, partial [Spirochaetaceae bacterium]|nr:hypothetical protein [Spirochaetaceae bacterium]
MKKRTTAFFLCLNILFAMFIPGTLAAEIGAPSTDDANISEGSDLIVDDTTTPPTAPAGPGVPAVLSDLDIPCTTCGAVGCTEIHETGTETPPEQESLFDKLMEAEDMKSFEEIAIASNGEYYDLTSDEIEKLHGKVNELYEAIEEPTEDDEAKRAELCALLLALPNAPEYCEECGGFDSHENNCSLYTPVCSCTPVHADTCASLAGGECDCTLTHIDGCELYVPVTPPVEKTLFEKLMAATDMQDFENIALASNGEYNNLTNAGIRELHGKVIALYSALVQPTEADTAKRDYLCSILLSLPDAPKLCADCGQFDTHADTCPLQSQPDAEDKEEDIPQCSCGTNTDVHTEGCPLYAAFTVSFIAYYDGQETG